MMVGHNEEVRKHLIAFYHGSVASGHSGINATLQRIRQDFFKNKMKQDVYAFVRECDICQR